MSTSSYLIFIPEWFKLDEEELINCIKEHNLLLKREKLEIPKKKEIIINLAKEMIDDLKKGGRIWQYASGWEHSLAFYGIQTIIKKRNFIIKEFDMSSHTAELLAINLDKICEIYMTAFTPELSKNIREEK